MRLMRIVRISYLESYALGQSGANLNLNVDKTAPDLPYSPQHQERPNRVRQPSNGDS